MITKFFLSIFCFFFSSANQCQTSPTNNRPSYPSPTSIIVSTPTPESFKKVNSPQPMPGNNTFNIYLTSTAPSDGFQIHLKLPNAATNLKLSKNTVSGINILTDRVTGPDIWLAGITQNPTQPWTSKSKQLVGSFTFETSQTQNFELLLGSSTSIVEHKTGANLLDKNLSNITIEKAP